jgi:hypothetical protein
MGSLSPLRVTAEIDRAPNPHITSRLFIEKLVTLA